MGDKEEKRKRKCPAFQDRRATGEYGGDRARSAELLPHVGTNFTKGTDIIVHTVVTGQPPPTTATAATVILYI